MKRLGPRQKINLAVAFGAVALIASVGSLAFSISDRLNRSDTDADYSDAAAAAGEAAAAAEAAAGDYYTNPPAIDKLRDDYQQLQDRVEEIRLQSERNARAASDATDAADEAREEAERAKAKALEPCIVHGIC